MQPSIWFLSCPPNEMKVLYGKKHLNKGSSVPGGEKNRQATEVQEVQSVIFFLSSPLKINGCFGKKQQRAGSLSNTTETTQITLLSLIYSLHQSTITNDHSADHNLIINTLLIHLWSIPVLNPEPCIWIFPKSVSLLAGSNRDVTENCGAKSLKEW